MKDEEIRGLIKGYMEARHCNRLEDLRNHTGIRSNKTFLKKWHNPRLFTLEEILDIFNYLKIPYEDRENVLKT